MEVKKTPQADLNRKKGLFFNLGLIITLIVCITAFNWKFLDNLEMVDLGKLEAEEEMLDLKLYKIPEPPKPILKNPIIVEKENESKIDEKSIELEEFEEEGSPEPQQEVEIPKPIIEIENEPVPDEPLIISEVQPEPVGGLKEFYTYVKKEIQYPKQARRAGVEGRVFVQFVVDKEGKLTHFKILKGIGSGCDEEAIRVLSKAPHWKPGKQRGRPVRVQMSLPIVFKLE